VLLSVSISTTTKKTKSSKSHLPQAEWEKLINDKIGKCDLLIVLVGKKSFSATGVVKELSFAKANSIPVFGVYVDGANSLTNLPSGLQRNRTIDWTWDGIASMITQCVTEKSR
jgi:hypothetical protein